MLSKQLQEQIEQEAKSSAADFNYYPGSTECEDLESPYTTAATKYAALYETALARAERAEKALRLIEQMSDGGDYYLDMCRMKSIATNTLNS